MSLRVCGACIKHARLSPRDWPAQCSSPLRCVAPVSRHASRRTIFPARPEYLCALRRLLPPRISRWIIAFTSRSRIAVEAAREKLIMRCPQPSAFFLPCAPAVSPSIAFRSPSSHNSGGHRRQKEPRRLGLRFFVPLQQFYPRFTQIFVLRKDTASVLHLRTLKLLLRVEKLYSRDNLNCSLKKQGNSEESKTNIGFTINYLLVKFIQF